ncbi:RluA family pseudouridine synthase [Aquimarina sp. U1-2]|uniref:RluA family pseudouridine synthase n=1 Tax=Aquimarina sp. U1-2 TaxID=2823141 RepID=UPI001AEC7778|nr:RluA family pseudouridine synthase [Aquimarina sp. U1-2]MBP2830787.1 RluA family pseudouridine synthase [Aquimarina sp. U1-2]
MEEHPESKDFDQTEDDLYEHHRFVAGAGQVPLRVDKFLMNFVENATRNKIQQAAKNGSVFVNDIPVKSNHKVKPHDVVKVLFSHPPYENLLTPENIELDIVYEDEVVLVVNKPAGMVVHPGHGNYSGTLINALIYHFDHLPNNSSNRPGLVHRIDKDTSGLLVIAKTEKAMTHLAKQFFDKTSEREYVALVWGVITENQGTIIGNIGRHPKNRLQNTVFEGEDAEKGKPAVTHYKVIERLGYVTLVSCRLETGRTHQIRVHMKHMGHTLFNDERYGGEKILKGTTFTKYKQFVENCFKVLPRQALHARTLGFEHPVTGKKMLFETEIPEDMAQCVERWRNYAKNR